MDGERDECVDEYPAVQMPFRHVGHLLFLIVDRHFFIQSYRMDAEYLIEPVEDAPVGAV